MIVLFKIDLADPSSHEGLVEDVLIVCKGVRGCKEEGREGGRVYLSILSIKENLNGFGLVSLLWLLSIDCINKVIAINRANKS